MPKARTESLPGLLFEELVFIEPILMKILSNRREEVLAMRFPSDCFWVRISFHFEDNPLEARENDNLGITSRGLMIASCKLRGAA